MIILIIIQVSLLVILFILMVYNWSEYSKIRKRIKEKERKSIN